MARTPKPWYWRKRKSWFITLAGQRHNLGPDRAEALRQFHELMLRPVPKVVTTTSVVGLVDQFLDWTQKHRATPTYDWYVERTSSFCKTLPPNLAVSQLKPFHLQAWLDAHPTWSDGMKRGSIIAVMRVFHWAAKLGYIERSPIAHFEKPQAGRRERVISANEYATILANVRDAEFRDLLTVAWECGPRPQEILRVEARHVDLEHARWVFRTTESKGKKRERVVYLTETALAITKRLMFKHHDGPLFRNADGVAWTPYAVNCRFERLKRKLDVKFCLYLFRHSWMTRLLKAGVDPITVSTLAGHVDTSMLARVYAHFSNDAEHLRKSLGRVAG